MKRLLLILIGGILSTSIVVGDDIDEVKKLLSQIEGKTQQAAEVLERLRPTPPAPPEPPEAPSQTGKVPFSIVAMRMPRHGDSRPNWPSANRPYEIDGNCDLILIKSDGTEEVLVDVGPTQACMDPQVSFDGKTVYFSILKGIDHNNKRMHNSVAADVYALDVETRIVRQITQQIQGRPTLNIGASPLGNDRLLFVSDRATPRLDFFGTKRTLQLHVIDTDGQNLEQVGFLNLHGALHPSVMPSGRAMWSSGEGMAWRGDDQWGLWQSNPDGTDWGPLWSAFTSHSGLPNPVHFQTALPDGRVLVTQYYKAKNFGTGIMHLFDPTTGFSSPARLFHPQGAVNLTPHSPLKDWRAPKGGSAWNFDHVGKWSHPAAAPNNGFLVTWTGPSPANEEVKGSGYLPQPWGTICYVPTPKVINGLGDFVVVKQSEDFSYIQPVALVPYRAIHGVDAPPEKPWLPQGNHPALPLGSPHGIIGTDSVYTRESATSRGNSPWRAQGSDVAVGYENSDIHYVRILLEELAMDQRTQTYSFGNVSPERLKILGDIPLRKFDAEGNPILDSNGDPDTRFRVKLPADQAFTFQLLNKEHEVLTMAQTWRMVRPGELHDNCRGCHAHWKPSQVDMLTTWAAKNPPHDLTTAKPQGYDYATDVKPILEQHCTKCHDGKNPDAINLDLALNKVWKINSKVAVPFRSLDSPIMARLKSADPATRMPLDHPPLPAEKIAIIAKWIDTGCQDKNGNVDDTRPTLHIETPRRRIAEPIKEIRLGVADSYGIASVSVTCSWLSGEQFGNFSESPAGSGVFVMPLPEPVEAGQVTVIVTDRSGNTQTGVRSFRPETGAAKNASR